MDASIEVLDRAKEAAKKGKKGKKKVKEKKQVIIGEV